MDTNTLTIREKISTYIKDNIHSEKDKIDDDALIFREGLLDSMGFIMLISFLEEQFGFKTGDTDLVEENFESISAISDFVLRKTVK